MDRKEILLYLISRSNAIQGKTRLQKLVFLLQEEKQLPLTYKFFPYDQGPLSFELVEEINCLVNNGFVTESVVLTPYAPRHDYKLSNIGEEFVNIIVEKKLRQIEKDKIQDIIKQWNNQNLNSLLSYVHNKYPEFKI